MIDIQSDDQKDYGVCWGWSILDTHNYLKFQDNFGEPREWKDDIIEQDYFPKLTIVHRRKMIQDLFKI